MEEKSRKYTILWFLFLVVNVLIVAFIAWREFHGEIGRTGPVLSEHALLYLFAALLCLALVFLSETAKCYLTMRFLGEPTTLYGAFETVTLGRYYDALMPTGGGGQPFQIYWLSRNGYSTRASSVMPASYFITRQAASILLTLLTFFAWHRSVSSSLRYAAYAGLFFCALPPSLETAFSLRPKAVTGLVRQILSLGVKLHLVKDYDRALASVLGILSKYHEGFTLLTGNRIILFQLMALSIVCRIALCSMPFCVLRTLGCEAGYGETLFLTIYIYSAVTLIPTPGNSGVSEGAFYLVFSPLGSEGVFWAMLGWRLLCYYSFLAAGILLFGVRTFSPKNRKNTGE